MNKKKHLLYLCAGVGMLIYALPQIQIGNGWSSSSLFGAAWLGFALLFIAAQLHSLLGVDEEMERQFVQLRRIRRRQAEQFILNKMLPGQRGSQTSK